MNKILNTLAEYPPLAFALGIIVFLVLMVLASLASADPPAVPKEQWYLVQITKFKNFTRVQFMGQFDNEGACQTLLEKHKDVPRVSCKNDDMLAKVAEEAATPGVDL
jgi:hypothetical protein